MKKEVKNQVLLDEIVGKIFPQKCGDSVLVLNKTNFQNKQKEYLYKVQFKKYFYIDYKTKGAILRGSCLNPEIERIEFLEKEWPQNCGDILIILEKTEKKSYTTFLYRCKFKNHPYEVLATKEHIKRGVINNPQIEIDEFINREWPQKCGDILIVFNEIQGEGNNKKFKCQFKNHPYKLFAPKSNIIKGSVWNPQIEIDEFVNKIWPQHCGDSLRIIKKNESNSKLWECEFINNSCKILATKYRIINGECKNYTINFAYNTEEFTLRQYIKDICGKMYSNYNDVNYEIDIYIPELKIGFEYNGSYWHNLREKNEPGYHQKKFEYFLNKGIIIFNIWDYFWFDDLNKNGQTQNYHIREEAKMYIKSIIYAFTIINYNKNLCLI